MPLGHGFEHYFGIPFSVDMGKSAWSPKGQFPPLALVHGDTVLEQPANLDTLSVRYADFASGFITNATKAGTPFLPRRHWPPDDTHAEHRRASERRRALHGVVLRLPHMQPVARGDAYGPALRALRHVRRQLARRRLLEQAGRRPPDQ